MLSIDIPRSKAVRETAYQTLARIAAVEDPVKRKESLLAELLVNNPLAIVVQRVYHPNYNFDLPAEIDGRYKKSGHDEPNPFYSSIKRWDIFRVPEENPKNIGREKKEEQFISLYESVASDDTELLIAVKNKLLPWETLSQDFIMDCLPHLFPHSFRQPTQNSSPKKTITGSKKDQCKKIIQDNPGLTRKQYIELFTGQVGVSKATASLYYQDLKNAEVLV